MLDEVRVCIQCGETKPLNKDYFGHTQQGRFRNQCRKCINANSKAHWKKHPEILERNRRNRKNKLGKRKPTAELLEKIKKELNFQCAYCIRSLEESCQVEHILPIAKGGLNDETNITLACKECNADKCQKTNQEFYEWRKLRGYPIRMILINGEDRIENREDCK